MQKSQAFLYNNDRQTKSKLKIKAILCGLSEITVGILLIYSWENYLNLFLTKNKKISLFGGKIPTNIASPVKKKKKKKKRKRNKEPYPERIKLCSKFLQN